MRFREFTGENAPDWEQRKLGEVANMHARIGWQNLRTSEFLDSGEYMLITGTDFQDGKIDYSKVHYVEKERYEQDKKIQISNGSILITKDGTIGKVVYVENLPMKSTLNAGVFNLTVVDDINTSSLYLYHYLKGPFLLRFVNEESTGGTIKHLNQNVLVKFPIPLPIYREQLKVSSFLTNIDKLITLHQRKLEQLEQLKNTLLSKMFPKSGTNIPEIRFSGFTDAWKQRQLGELTQINTGSGDLQDSVIDGKYPFFVRSEKIERSNRYIFDGEAILIPGEGKLGEIYHYIDGKFDYHQRVYKISNFSDSNTFGKFILFELNKNFKKHALKYTVKATVDSLRLPTLKKYQILVPGYYEQVKIGEYFFSINNYIAIHQRKLEQLKNLKQTLLNKMFV